MSSKIKAIPTFYDGYWFRSKLEAKWAVFFNALSVKYEYEPEGFILPDGSKYLPDFRVKCWGKRGKIRSKTDEHGSLCCSCGYCMTGDPYFYQHECPYAKNTEFNSSWNNACNHCDNYVGSNRYPFDLYIEVKGEMDENSARKISLFAGEHSSIDENGMIEYLYYDNPILVVGNIPLPEDATDSYALGVYEGMNGTGILPFNYELIDGDCFGAYPAADEKGRFYLFGDDSNYIDGNLSRVKAAYARARAARFDHGARP